ncbi:MULTISPECIES: hypothetical protein [Sorangium]|nr:MULTISPECIES: hypothetical protein [Sorangium]
MFGALAGLSWPMLERQLGPDGRRDIELATARAVPVDLANDVRLTAVRHPRR